jgi:preprotein translocase subunit YajC
MPMPISPMLLAATKASKTTSSGSDVSLLIIILLIVAFYFLFVRPRSRQAKQQRQILQTLSPGDEVLTGAGIYGTVLDVMPDRVTIETAPGTRITVARSTIARRIEPSDHPLSQSWGQAGSSPATDVEEEPEQDQFEDEDQAEDEDEVEDEVWDEDEEWDEEDGQQDADWEDEADDAEDAEALEETGEPSSVADAAQEVPDAEGPDAGGETAPQAASSPPASGSASRRSSSRGRRR